MRRYGDMFIKVTIFFSVAILLISCGGGGGGGTSRGGGENALLTDSNAAETSDILVQAVKLVTPTSSLGELNTSSVTSDGSPIIRVAEKVIAAMAPSITNSVSAAGLINENCSDGGSINIDIDKIDIVKKRVTADVTVTSCKTGSEILDGRMKVQYEVGSDALTNPTIDNLRDFDKVTITSSEFTYFDSDKSDNIKLMEVTLVLEDFSYNGDDLRGGSIRVGGTITGILDGEAISIKCDSFKLTFRKDPVAGDTVSVSGRLQPSCLNGWVRLTTKSPVFIAPNAECPTGGNITFSSGENITEVIVADNSEIKVYFNNVLVQTFSNCLMSKGLCFGG